MPNWLANEQEWSYQRQLPADMPDWLRAQYSWVEDDGGNGRWTRSGLADSQGRSVVQVGEGGRNLYQDEGVFRDPSAYRQDADLGFVTDESNWDPSIGRDRRSNRERVAMAIMAGMAGAGALGLAGEGAAVGTLGDAGMLNAADWIVPAADGTLGSWAGTGLEAGLGAGAGAIPDAGMLNAADWIVPAADPALDALPAVEAIRGGTSFANDLRQLLGGNAQPGGNSTTVLGALGAAPRIGEHRPNNDPYGLQASGYGPWAGLTKEKVVDALMKQNKPPSIWD